MRPKKILIVRHAEKPGQAHVEHEDDGPHLSADGHTRAAGLAKHKDRLFGTWGDKGIDHIIATAPSKHSIRPIETVAILADEMKVKVKTKYADDEFKKLAKRLLSNKKYHDATILICWHHGKLPHLIKALGGSTRVAPIKNDEWDPNTFDRTIVLTFGNDAKVITRSVPHQLLFKDSEK